jgi:uncharacterized membrane protein YcaP (DUF421 family)
LESLIPDIPVVEKLVRTAVIYGFLLVAFRLAGKRQLGQMSPFDLIVLLVISNAVQNPLTMRFRGFGGLVENTPTILVPHGQVLADSLRRECMTLPELRAALRREGVVSVGDVRYAILEEDGHVSVIRRRPA